jgi:PAS domain S-box-containing protein
VSRCSRDTVEVPRFIPEVSSRTLEYRVVAPSGSSFRDTDFASSHLASIVAWSDDAIVSMDLDGAIRSWNRAAERMFGHTAGEMIGRSITTIVPEDRRPEEHEVLERIRSGLSVDRFETVRVCKDGTLLDVSITVSPIRNAEGEIVGASKISRDITDWKRQQRRVEELLERERAAVAEAASARDRLQFLGEITTALSSSLDYQQTLDNAVHLALPAFGDYSTVLVQDDSGAMKLVACGHVMREREPIIREIARRFAEQQNDDVPTLSASVIRTGQPRLVRRVLESPEFQHVSRARPDLATSMNSAFIPLSYIGAPLVVRGRLAGVISFGTTVDVSNREYTEADVPPVMEFARRAALAIENARLFRQADELNRLKDEFLATLSHELRTPLNAILGWARLLADNRLKDEAAHRAVVAIERNATAQSKIVDDILDVARGVAGNLALDPTPLDLAEVAQRGVDGITPSAAAKHIRIDLVAPSRPVPITGDAARLAQVVGNLLSNAVKFTPDGGKVLLDVRESDGEAVLSVIDTGIGIPAAFLPHVFDKFRQADGSFTRRYGGLGLGLAITRHLVELHGGSVEVQSEGKNMGATFIVRLPITPR